MMKRYLHLLFTLSIMIFAFSGCSAISTNNTITNTENITSAEIAIKDSKPTIDSFVEEFNNISNNKITITENVKSLSESSVEYRTEYRLNAYKDAIAETGTIANKTIDIIDYSSNTVGNQKNLRIYTSADKSEDMLNILKTSIKILDSSITEDEINSVADYIYEYGSKSFYLGNSISGYISGGKDGPYEIMINFSKYMR